MRAKKIFEKFKEESDPIRDMGIGSDIRDIIISEYLQKFEKEYKKYVVTP